MCLLLEATCNRESKSNLRKSGKQLAEASHGPSHGVVSPPLPSSDAGLGTSSPGASRACSTPVPASCANELAWPGVAGVAVAPTTVPAPAVLCVGATELGASLPDSDAALDKKRRPQSCHQVEKRSWKLETLAYVKNGPRGFRKPDPRRYATRHTPSAQTSTSHSLPSRQSWLPTALPPSMLVRQAWG